MMLLWPTKLLLCTRGCKELSFCLRGHVFRHFTSSKNGLLKVTKKRHSKFLSHKSVSSTSKYSYSHSVEANSQSSILRQRFIFVHTNVGRWLDIPGGVFLDVAYLDSAPGDKINPSVPVVVGLHSTPGSFYDLEPVLEACAKSGCRVLAPSFPGLGYTEGVMREYNDVFTHTTEEKAEFVRDFLNNLGVEKVDLLIAQGAGCYPALCLTARKDTNSIFRSVAFVSPWPHKQFRGTKRHNLQQLLYDMWERPFYRPIARVLSHFVPNTAKQNPTARMTTVYTLQNISFSEIGGYAVAVEANSIPRVMFFAEDDDYVDAKLSYDLAKLMGINTESIHRFTGQLDRCKMNEFPLCIVFENGGQNVPKVHSGVITAVIFNLLRSVQPNFMLNRISIT